ncbi:hypothetical protein [Tenacibaculum maritimum]|uniref:hypothetical protein n=1 Tax=Tenacibaculum maritimum TaxID=107401 RepID=UPI000416F0B4|nr:hypothetical protein [Tenacibaculum maritimum]MDB0599814.1 hypothetical protein [Tenacibaculum maritimum]MDB0610924.1 hypothetical protein [Tenacibaculum maritimum]CAA0260010.1 hypothetical protein TMFC_90011 [Tenacibaculum maritimum]
MAKKVETKDIYLKLKQLENMLATSLIDAREIQELNSTREMSMVIRSIEDAQDKLWRLEDEYDD